MILLNTSPVTILIGLVFLYPLIKGFLFKFSSKDLKLDIDDVNRNISFIIALITGIYFWRKIFIQHSYNLYNILPEYIGNYFENNSFLVYAIVIPVFIFIVYRIIKLLLNLMNYLTLYPLIDSIDGFLKFKSNIFKRILGMIFQLPRSICYVLLISFILNIISMFNINSKLNTYLESSRPYNSICREIIIPVTNSNIAKQLPNIINNSFKIVIKQSNSKDTQNVNDLSRFKNDEGSIIYYNGVTIEEGIKSNQEINTFAKALGTEGSNTTERSEILYNWIGTNISYDHEKATKVLSNDFDVQSGAIPTFSSKKGICFDYACLYVAMARANNMKVRLITGEGFNGINWVSHAWNQVYIPEGNQWINVDTTFYKGGDYFNSKRFQLDHRDSQIAGEW
ncbi:hypothetical protein CKR_2935 [Clostridium kluyveri NBRC 12016]|uniref:Transglutaminase-like domain-containing protein n=1 Tax=Clostridium kluyveri (strain NBRC 12016) TaxID=583346 RepID=B9E661_CLOK1|nr:hypothetical protein CKR_2935 [Clostridium kluyveri NBRC 12016]